MFLRLSNLWLNLALVRDIKADREHRRLTLRFTDGGTIVLDDDQADVLANWLGENDIDTREDGAPLWPMRG
jgi:hypothetical protein